MSALNGTSVPASSSSTYLEKGYGSGSVSRSHLATGGATDYGVTPGNPSESSPLSLSVAQQNFGRFNEEWDVSQRGSSIVDGALERSNSGMSQGDTLTPSRGGTLKKKASIKKGSSLRRSSSRRSSKAGSVRSLALQAPGDTDETHSAFYSPVPTSGNPTEILSNRFQAWRKVLKDLITYFKEVQTSYEHNAKSVLKVSNIVNNITAPPVLLASGGIDDALKVLRDHHKNVIVEANKSRDIESDVILALVGLRSDLSQKIKEIKSLSGDFKNSVEKEMENTRKAVNQLQEGLGQSDVDASQATGKQDPYILKLAVDRQVERQIDEENYLHQAYLNLEASGRELEAIVVGEIQKAYNAYAGILKREADGAYSAVEELRTGPIAMPKDHEWNAFIEKDEHFIDPRLPVREAQYIQYPGRDDELAQEVRAGLMERKSKYLKSYTAGWYVLSPTHLHEFKSADKTQAPIMSLYLPEQKLGSHSSSDGSSNKFMLKGRQTGSMHRGHSWVFRCESMETMLAWYEDIKALTEKSPQERSAFVRQHARSISNASQKAASVSSDGGLDEEDEEPFSAAASAVVASTPKQDVLPRRPQGGRFPSDIQVNTMAQRGLQAPLSPSSGSSGFGDAQNHDIIADSGNMPGSVGGQYGDVTSPTHAAMVNQLAQEDGVNPYTYQPLSQSTEHDTGEIAAAGADLGAIGTEPTKEYKKRLADQAALESEYIAAPDTYEQQSEQHAAIEAARISAPDILTPIPSDPNFMSGGRSMGEFNAATSKTPIEHNLIKEALEPITTDNMRPTLAAGQKHQSVQSVSQLHIPGEFPKAIA